MKQKQQNHRIKTANITRGGYLNSFYCPILRLSVCIYFIHLYKNSALKTITETFFGFNVLLIN